MEAAASIIAFAQAAKAVTSCVIATKRLWEEVKDLPEEIESVITELQIWAPLFADLESQLKSSDIPKSFWDDSTAITGLELAKRAHANFETFANDLSDHLNARRGIKRKVKAAKICLRKDTWERFEKKLSRTLSLLRHSVSCYQLALTRYSPQVIARRVTNDLTKEIHGLLKPGVMPPEGPSKPSKTEEPNSTNALAIRVKSSTCAKTEYCPSYLGRFAYASSKDTGAWQACVEMPSWLSRSVFEFTSRPRLSGWSWSYRVYNVVPRDAEILTRVEEGDMNGLLELVKSGKGSFLDKDEKGNSLLYYATQWNQYEICRMLIRNGLGDLLDDQVGELKKSPLSVLTYERGDWRTPHTDLAQITELYQSILEANGSVSVERLFDFIQEWAIADEFVIAFQEKFMPKWYYRSSLHDRLEAVRLGSFHVTSPGTLRKLIAKDWEILALDVTLSTHEKLSLVHSVGIAFGIRYADEMLPYKRAEFQWRVYTEDWGILVSQVASVAQTDDLHALEIITPWDVYQVPAWTGTPLISVLGGALCYISPETSFIRWDRVLQGTLRQWLECLKFAGVDLEEYGQKERSLLHENFKGALDDDAINKSRTMIRNTMAFAAKDAIISRLDLHKTCWNENHWVPIRLIDLHFGSSPSDWDIIWAPEFEVMACQFWNLIERETIVMPGTWVED